MNGFKLLGFELVYVLVPGLAAYAAAGSFDLGRGLVVGIALGYALCAGSFLLSQALGLPWIFLAYPLPFFIAGVAQLQACRGCVRLPALEWKPAAGLALIASAAAALVYLEGWAQFRLPSEGADVFACCADLTLLSSITAELKHHWPPLLPFIAGEGHDYHYLAYARIAATSVATGLPLIDLTYRFVMIPTLALLACQLVWLGRRVAGSWSAGLWSAALVLLMRDVVPYDQSLFMGGAFFANVLTSPSFLLGCIFELALLIELCELAAPGGRFGPRRAALLGILFFAATATKGTVPPAVIGGAALTAVWAWRDASRALARRMAAAAAIGMVSFLALSAMMFRHSQPVWIEFLHIVSIDPVILLGMLKLLPGPALAVTAALKAFVLAVLLSVYVLGAALGWRWVREREVAVFLLVTAALDIVAGLFAAHRGGSEVYFVLGAMLAVSPLAGLGIARAFSGATLRSPGVALKIACGLALLSSGLQAARTYRHSRARDRVLASSPRAFFNSDVLAGLRWTRDHTPISAIVLSNVYSIGCAGYAAISERRQVFESVVMSSRWQALNPGYGEVSYKPYENLRRQIDAVFNGGERAALRSLARERGATHLAVQRGSPHRLPPRLTDGLELLYKNDSFSLYRLPF